MCACKHVHLWMWVWTLWIWATKYFFTSGVGCFGAATILIAQHKPCHHFTVLRSIDLELLTVSQLEEVQHEMKLSQLLLHPNITCYICSFVVGTKLWAVQPLMHYGKWMRCVCSGTHELPVNMTCFTYGTGVICFFTAGCSLCAAGIRTCTSRLWASNFTHALCDHGIVRDVSSDSLLSSLPAAAV